MPCSSPRSRMQPALEMPLPNSISNSACLNGGATLFLTTFTRTRLPIASVPSLSVSIRRMSSRCDEKNFSARPPGWVSGEPNMTPTFSRIWLTNRHSVCVRFRLPASLRMAWDIIRAGAHEHVGDLERLLAVVGLGDQQLVDVHAEPAGVQRVHGVLGVDERADAAELLGLGDHVVDERRLARGLRAEDLHDPAARHAADAEREVQRQRARGDRVDLDLGALVAHAHDRADRKSTRLNSS